jgi:glycosyltransferase involved in cell wall biosynthesis
MSSSVPDVTVVIPTRDRAELALVAASSALAQEGVEVEVVVVDDGSRAPVAGLLDRLGDPRLRVLRREPSAGVSSARNLGIAEASGEWVAFLDDDDFWAPFKLRGQLASARAAGASFAYSGAVVVDASGGVIQIAQPPPAEQLPRLLLDHNAVPGGCSNVVVWRSLLEELGGFDERLSTMADWDLWIRLAHAAPGAADPEIAVAYVRHGGSMVIRGDYDALAELDYLAQKHAALSRAAGVEFDRRRLYRYFARAHRRGGRRMAAARVYLRGAFAYRSGGDLVRAAAVLLGEDALALGARLRGRPPRLRRAGVADPPSWLSLYLPAEAAEETLGTGWRPIAPRQHAA